MSDGRQEVGKLESDVDLIRANLGDLIGELNNRRRDALDIRLQFQRHAGRLVLAGVVVIAMVAGGIALFVSRVRRRRSLPVRADRLGKALRRALAHPEHVAERRPSVPRKIAAAGGSAIASALGKRIASRLVSA
jgi:hypothetical protein